MTIEAFGIPSIALSEYARIPIAFEVSAVLDVREPLDGGGFILTERRIQTPYLKDCDAIAETPTEWPGRFDTSKWILMTARAYPECPEEVQLLWHKDLDQADGGEKGGAGANPS